MIMSLIAQSFTGGAELLAVFVPLALFVYLVILATRFVRAIEKIADKLNRC